MKQLCERLNLTTLAAEIDPLLETARQQQWSYAVFLDAALQAELVGRQERAQERRRRSARLPFPARLESFDFRFQPGVSERLIHELASLAFMGSATNVVLLGPPGVGKTHLACGLAVAALEAGHTAQFVTLRELLVQIDAPGPRGGLRDSGHYASHYVSEMIHGSRVVRTDQMDPQPMDNRVVQVSVLSVEEGVSFKIGSTCPNGLNP